jgi:hypothetical protein
VSLTFDHVAKRIGVPQAAAQPLSLQALINAIREEEATVRGICYEQIADATGKADLGGGVLTGITLNLRSSWALQFEAGAYQATVNGGNLADALARIANTGSPQVLVQSSAAATVVNGEGGTGPTEGAIAAAVWASAGRTLTGVTPANVKQVNDVPIAGTGAWPADPWRPA